MIGLPDALRRRLQVRRPVLRVQLALLYSGVFIVLVVALFAASSVLFGTSNVFFGHSVSAYHAGAPHPAANPGPPSPWPLLVALALVAIGVLSAWWLAGRFLRPLRAMTAAAQEISATNLTRRLDLTGPEDELTELGRTLDGLFGRLHASFEAQRQFVANASHELRTPLAGQRTLLQVALADPAPTASALRATCEEALALCDDQEHLIDALLTLSVGEAGVESWAPIDLARLADAAITRRIPEAEQCSIVVRTRLEAAPTVGEASLVESLIVNLLDNAIRHNHPGGSIEITTSMTRERARLSVANTGPTIPPREVERLFRPFQRLDPQRLGSGDGHGLGLTIVQTIARAHGASLVARVRPQGGLDVDVTFPRSPARCRSGKRESSSGR